MADKKGALICIFVQYSPGRPTDGFDAIAGICRVKLVTLPPRVHADG